MAAKQTGRAVVSFAAGEWSPQAGARMDLPRHLMAAKRLRNFIVERYGSVRRRPGLEQISYSYIAPPVIPVDIYEVSVLGRHAMDSVDDYDYLDTESLL